MMAATEVGETPRTTIIGSSGNSEADAWIKTNRTGSALPPIESRTGSALVDAPSMVNTLLPQRIHEPGANRLERRHARDDRWTGHRLLDLVLYAVYFLCAPTYVLGVLWVADVTRNLASSHEALSLYAYVAGAGWISTALIVATVLTPLATVHGQLHTWSFTDSIRDGATATAAGGRSGAGGTRLWSVFLRSSLCRWLSVAACAIVFQSAETLAALLLPAQAVVAWSTLIGSVGLLFALVAIGRALAARPLVVFRAYDSAPAPAPAPTSEAAVTPTLHSAAGIPTAPHPATVAADSSTSAHRPAVVSAATASMNISEILRRTGTTILVNRQQEAVFSDQPEHVVPAGLLALTLLWSLYLLLVHYLSGGWIPETMATVWTLYLTLCSLVGLTWYVSRQLGDTASATVRPLGLSQVIGSPTLVYSPMAFVLFGLSTVCFLVTVGPCMNMLYRIMSVSQASSGSFSGTWQSPNASVWMYVAYLVLNEAAFGMWKAVLALATAPYLYARFLFPYQVWSALCPYAIFGFTPLSWQLVAMFAIGLLHQTMWVTDGYRRAVQAVQGRLGHCCTRGTDHPATAGNARRTDASAAAVSARAPATTPVVAGVIDALPGDAGARPSAPRELEGCTHTAQQEVKVFQTMMTLVNDGRLAWQEGLAVLEVLVSFTMLLRGLQLCGFDTWFSSRFVLGLELLAVVSLQCVFRLILWLLTYRILQRRIHAILVAHTKHRRQRVPSTLSHLLQSYLTRGLRLDPHTLVYHAVKQGFELDHPELFSPTVCSNPATISEYLLRWQQWFPTPLRKQFWYFVVSSCVVYLGAFLGNTACHARWFGVDDQRIPQLTTCLAGRSLS